MEDTQDKYLWLMDFGKNSMPLVEQLRLDRFLVPGCQTQTWLVPGFMDNRKMHFSADSDALISKGMVSLIADVFSGSTPEEIDEMVYMVCYKQLNHTENKWSGGKAG